MPKLNAGAAVEVPASGVNIDISPDFWVLNWNGVGAAVVVVGFAPNSDSLFGVSLLVLPNWNGEFVVDKAGCCSVLPN